MRAAESLEQMLLSQDSMTQIVMNPKDALGSDHHRHVETIQNQLNVVHGCNPFYWTAQCADFVAAAGCGLDPSTVTASRELLHVDKAWFWFEHPFLTVTYGANSSQIEAITAAWVRFGKTDREALLVCGFSRVSGHLIPYIATWVNDGETIAEGVKNPDDGSDDTFIRDAMPLLRFIVAAGAFLRTKAPVTVATERVDRHARKRLIRQGYEGDDTVQVVTLRARENSRHESGEAGEVNWSHRWIVMGHWRQQWYQSTGRHLPIWIHPFIKGPEEKPLKRCGRPIFAVRR